MTQPDQRMAQAFDDLAGSYDDAYHDEVARALVAFAAPTGAASVADVACGTGAVAIAVAQARSAGPGGAPVLAFDLSPGMIAAGRARAARLALTGAIDWRVAPALPLPVADADLDLVLCASSLHFLGRPALADWLRALRPGGRVGFTLPLAADFRPRGVFADLLATDLVLPGTAEAAAALARSAGFTGAAARTVAVGARTVALVRAQAPAQAPAPTPAARAATRS